MRCLGERQLGNRVFRRECRPEMSIDNVARSTDGLSTDSGTLLSKSIRLLHASIHACTASLNDVTHFGDEDGMIVVSGPAVSARVNQERG
jgi:hypothetical protein